MGKIKKLALLEGAEAHHGGDVCVCGCGCVSILVPVLKHYGAGVFCSCLNLNSCKAVKTHTFDLGIFTQDVWEHKMCKVKLMCKKI
jgi:hypothetical protein